MPIISCLLIIDSILCINVAPLFDSFQKFTPLIIPPTGGRNLSATHLPPWEDRAYRNSPVGYFSERASLSRRQGWGSLHHQAGMGAFTIPEWN